MATFETQTNYFFIPSAKFLTVATPEEIALARVYPVVKSVDINKVYRSVKDVTRFTKAGINIKFVTKTQFVIDDQSIGTIGETTIGPMVVIDKIEDKYDDSMGAYQIAYGRDAEGNEMSESNMYSTNELFVLGEVK
jgi:hypothetical protein